jgi:hypothetical protein
MATFGMDGAAFLFFLAFAGDVMDRYGRLLGYIQPTSRPADHPGRPAAGLVQRADAEKRDGSARISYCPTLTRGGRIRPSSTRSRHRVRRRRPQALMRRWARRGSRWRTRQQQIGLLEPGQPLRLLAFELRLPSRQQPPDRWLIDLSSDSDALIPPQSYPRVALPEDRQFIPAEFVPLRIGKGWQRPWFGRSILSADHERF